MGKGYELPANHRERSAAKRDPGYKHTRQGRQQCDIHNQSPAHQFNDNKMDGLDEERMSVSDGSDVDMKDNSEEGMTAEEIANNKLKHNIAKKGANSYYYAHAKKAEAPTVRNEPPQLLKTVQANVSIKLTQPFEKFAWSNEKSKVTVYLTFPGADQVPDDKIQLSTEKKLFEIKVENQDGVCYGLRVPKLNGEISGADLKKKADKFVVTLKKVEERTWYRLEE